MDLPRTETSSRLSTIVLVTLILLPLGVIGFQLVFKLGEIWGNFGYSLYKVFFLIPPLIYCRLKGIHIFRDIFILKNWRRYLPVAVGLGIAALIIFWVAYFCAFLKRSTTDKNGSVTHSRRRYLHHIVFRRRPMNIAGLLITLLTPS